MLYIWSIVDFRALSIDGILTSATFTFEQLLLRPAGEEMLEGFAGYSFNYCFTMKKWGMPAQKQFNVKQRLSISWPDGSIEHT